MKFLFIILLIFIVGCSHSKLHNSSKTIKNETVDTLYHVYKIDSLNSYYFIYAKQKGRLYKIISKKDIKFNEPQLTIGGTYNFDLFSILDQKIKIGNKVISTDPGGIISCFGLDDSTSVCKERDSINNLYRANNLIGLCIRVRSIGK